MQFSSPGTFPLWLANRSERFAGMLGALKVRAPDGKEFLLGTGFSAAQRRDPPPLGTTVTYRYRDLTSNGLPRFSSFLRIRNE